MLFFCLVIKLLSKIKLDKKNPEKSLILLVDEFANNQYSINSIPKDFANYFSIPGLVNALNIKLPEPPKFNQAFVEKIMKDNDYKNTDELANYIITKFNHPIDRLYAIFYYETHNILYDKESLLTNSIKYKTLEEIFESKLGVCGHFALFMNEMAKKCKINGLKIEEYYIYTKTFAEDPFNLPDKLESDHAAILVTYNNHLFVSEPTWTGGSLLSEYKPSYFLIPIEKTMSTHYPVKTKVSLPFTFSYEQFKKIQPILTSDADIKIESHPFWSYECNDGYMNFQFSCNSNVSKITCQMKKANETLTDENIYIETISGKRKRFIVHAIFPTEGMFELNLWLDKKYILTYYIKNQKSFTNSPLFISPVNDYRFTPIEPKEFMTDISSNSVIVKFISKKDSTHSLLYKMDDSDIWYYDPYLNEKHFNIPNNNDLSEKWIMFSFSKNGIYEMKLQIKSKLDSTQVLTIPFIYNVSIPKLIDQIPSLDLQIPEEKQKEIIQFEKDQTTPYLEELTNTTNLILKKGKDITDKIDFEIAQKKVGEIANSLKSFGENAYNNFDINKSTKTITELSNKLILMSKEMYDNYYPESTVNKFIESTNNLISKVKDLSNSIDSNDIKNKIFNVTDNMASYGKQIIDSINFENAKENVKSKTNYLINKGKQMYNNFNYEETKQKVKSNANNIFNKGKQMYNNFDYEETKENIQNSVKNKYNKASNFFKDLISKNDNEANIQDI